jgi:hypothetical protein
MNLSAFASLISIGIATSAGAIAGLDTGTLSGVIGTVIGFAIGLAVAFGVFAAENRIVKIPKLQGPRGSGIGFALLLAISVAAPALAGSASYFAAQAAGGLIANR